jgi:TolB-like protein/Flp pilus assembly protein TadD
MSAAGPIIGPVPRLRFDPFELDIEGGELRRETTPIPLQPQPFKVLAALALRAGKLVSREELQKQIWTHDTFVDFDQGLNYCIRRIRAVLGDDANAPSFVETVPRRGYRFVAPVAEVPAVPGAERRAMMAVLPFENLSGNPDEDYFSDGLTEEMIAQLSRLNPERLGVIARTSSMTYKRTNKSIDVIGRELGVSYALEGSVRRGADRVRVSAQLIQVSDQTHLWARSYDRGLGDMLALQSEVAHAIAREIQVQLTPAERSRLARVQPVVPLAYEAYLKGRYFWNQRSRKSLEKSVRNFQRAIEIDPGYAAGYAGLADVHLSQFDYNFLPARDAFTLAGRAVLDALCLDETLAEPHTSLGHLRLHQFDWESAEREFQRAITLNPGYQTAHYYYGNLLAALGRFEEAIAEARRALELDPISPSARQNVVFILYVARRYDQAIETANDAFELDPDFSALYYQQGLVYERKGEYRRAIEAFEAVSGTRSSNTVLAAMGFTQAMAGNSRAATEVLKRLSETATREYVSMYDLALLRLALGDLDQTFALLSRAYEDHSSFLPFLNVDARFDAVRSDRRFQALLHRLNFPND